MKVHFKLPLNVNGYELCENIDICNTVVAKTMDTLRMYVMLLSWLCFDSVSLLPIETRPIVSYLSGIDW